MYKTEVPGIYKQAEGILINKDNEALSKYKSRKDALREKDSRINRMEQKIENISSDMEEIKSLLRKLMAE